MISRYRSKWKSIGRLGVVGLFWIPIAFGQGERGAITGTVTDQSNAVIPETEITVVDVATNVKYATTSTGSGTYRVPSLPPGIYRITASKTGFKQALAEHIRVAVGTTVNVDLKMQVGESSQTVTVIEESPLLQTAPELGTDVSPQEFNTWPLFQSDQQRQPQDFIFNSLPGSSGSSFQGSINGGQNFGYEILVDGVALERNYLNGGSTDLTPSVESVSEFKLQTVNIGANYGGAGSAVVNFSIKSGTNEFHGTAYEFNSNSAFQSNGATTNFLRASDPTIKKGYYNQNNFGVAEINLLLWNLGRNSQPELRFWESYDPSNHAVEEWGFLRPIGIADRNGCFRPPCFSRRNFRPGDDPNGQWRTGSRSSHVPGPP